jgi:hypothetical protein
VIEPRKIRLVVEADTVARVKAAPKRPRVTGAEAPPGSKNRARWQRHHRNLGDLTTSGEIRARKPEEIRGLRESRACMQEPTRDTKKARTRSNRGAKENEARRDGW